MGRDPRTEPPQGRSVTRTGGPSRWGEIRLAGAAGRGIPRAFPRKPVGPLPNYTNNSKYRGRALAGEGGNELTRDPASRRATVILFGLCVVAASAIAGAAEYRYSAFEIPPSPDMIGRVYEWSFRTPAYGAASFQEQPVVVSIGPVTAVQDDSSGDGKVDAYTIRVPLTVGAEFVSMEPGAQEVTLFVSPEQVYLSGIDGPTDIHITVIEAQVRTESHPCCGTEAAEFVEEPAFAAPPDGSELGLRQPYVLPPTPLGLKAETRLEATLHWYDFQAPWMPIEFTGEVRDYGTDADGDGLFESLTVEAAVSVRNWGWYDVSGTLYAAGSAPSNVALMRSVPTEDHVVTTAWNRVNLGTDQSWVRIDFAGAEVLAAGRGGPFDAKLRIVPANVVIDPIAVHTTAAYTLAPFQPLGPKPPRLTSVGSEDLGGGTYAIHVGAPSDSSYRVITRVIHANGVVALDVAENAGGERVYSFSTESAAAADFAVAVYLMTSSGAGADYLEIPLAVA